MITIKDLSSVINDSALHELFIARNENLLAHLSKEDKANTKELYVKQKETRNRLNISLDNLPDCFEQTKENIVKDVENHIENMTSLSSYFDEKIYKSGVLDGIVFILESMRNKNECRNNRK